MDLTTIPLDSLLAEIRRRVESCAPVAEARPAHELTLVSLGEMVAGCHGIDAVWLAHECRTRRVANARRQFCVAARMALPGVTHAEIGGVIRRTYGAVIHALESHATLMATDAGYHHLWLAVESRLPSVSLHAFRRSSPQV